MADNQHFYGFRWHSSIAGHPMPKPKQIGVASGYQAAINGGGNVDLNIGDPIKQVAGGTAELAAGSEAAAGAAEAVWGILVAVRPYSRVGNSPTQLQPSDVLPGGTTYTNLADRSEIEVVPAAGSYWSIDCNNVGAVDTEEEFLALIGKNADHVLTDSGQNKADPYLNLNAGAPIAGTAQWRIEDIDRNVKNQDFAGANVSMVVTINETQQAPFVTTGT